MGGALDVVGKAIFKTKKEQEESKESSKVEKSPFATLNSLSPFFQAMLSMMPY